MERFLVSASTGAMSSLLGKLATIISDEFKLLKGVRADIRFLKDELEAMQAFLMVMADIEEPDKQTKLRADAVREMSYEIEDNIDKFMVLVEREPRSESDGFAKLFNSSTKKIGDIKIRHKIAKDVKDIKNQVKEVNKRYARYKIDESSRPRVEKTDPRLRAIYKDTSELIGIEGPRDDIVQWLSNEKGESVHQLKVVSIVGYGGLGKTTLARQVYEKLGSNYKCRAFVSISRTPDMTKILSSILSQLRNQDHAHVGDTQLIIEQIRNFLKDKRYFIVIDDVWDVQTWQAMECALVRNSCGSLIMTTTRINDVAKSCCSSDKDLVYKIQPLNDVHSKKLFFKRIFGSEEKCPANLKEASEGIVKRCGGLPLALNAISSLLATGKTKQEWDHVQSSIGFARGKNYEIDAMNYILLSYFDLPLHLRSCLLYLTMFPEDYEIQKERLVHRWMAEGFIRGEDGEDLVELGEAYFHELINRSLIQEVGIGYDGKAQACRVHDTVLDFLIYKSTHENFCTLLSTHSKTDSRVRRLSLMGDDDQGNLEQLDLSHARSLGAFGKSREYLPSLVKLNALRVLDVFHCHAFKNHHIKDIGRLFQLRYLNLCWTVISELPSQIGDLKFLETLDVFGTKLSHLPQSVTQLRRLARLFVPAGLKLPDGIGNMTSLQEIKDINTFVQSENVLEDLGNLTDMRKLKITWDSAKSDKASSKEKILVSSLCKLDQFKLRNLVVSIFLAENDLTFIRHPFFPSLHSIRAIFLRRGQLRWISKWLISLANLENLGVDAEEIEQQDVEMVGSIPTLLEYNQFSQCAGPVIIRGGFQQLQSLEFVLTVSGGLMFEVGAMPNLKTFYLHIFIHKFKPGGFDFGIQHLSSLAFLRVGIFCGGVRAADVEAAEGAFKSMTDAHPNRPTLETSRRRTEDMLQDE
ncbi:LOW QUALITY PROTEIN: hypothetical protein CFC21_004886 [Triticum aestivum]|uniref:Uncharacterized protein n=2 Tax=Triticum aestivum TaxID=4565 RepID=A0A9R1D8H9_WHEAT|nr:LOW QUALITY PROTEIN: hypothetical protein CFC21_004886 [Triticum aestivum]